MLYDNPRGPLVVMYDPPEEHLIVSRGKHGYCYTCEADIRPNKDGECPRYHKAVENWRYHKAFAQRR